MAKSSAQPFKRRPKAAVTPDMNVTPLVDVVLVLLIIFMVLAPVVSAHYLGRLPPPDEKDEQLAAETDNKPLVLKVSADENGLGIFKVGSETLEPERAADRLGRLLASRPDKVVYVDASDTTPYGLVLQGMSYAKDAEDIVNKLVREQDPSVEGRLRVTAVLVTKEIPVE